MAGEPSRPFLELRSPVDAAWRTRETTGGSSPVEPHTWSLRPAGDPSGLVAAQRLRPQVISDNWLNSAVSDKRAPGGDGASIAFHHLRVGLPAWNSSLSFFLSFICVFRSLFSCAKASWSLCYPASLSLSQLSIVCVLRNVSVFRLGFHPKLSSLSKPASRHQRTCGCIWEILCLIIYAPLNDGAKY